MPKSPALVGIWQARRVLSLVQSKGRRPDPFAEISGWQLLFAEALQSGQ